MLLLCFDITSFPVFLLLVHFGFGVFFPLCGGLRTFGGCLSCFLSFMQLSRARDLSFVLIDLSKAGF